MFNKNYRSEKTIKTIANAVLISGFVIAALAVLAMFILLGISAEYLWWVSLIVLGGGLFCLLMSYVFANLIWGFGEIVGNTGRIATGTGADTDIEEDLLPEI